MPYKFTKEDSRNGGIASGEARRNKRSLRQTMELLLSTELPEDAKKVLLDKGFSANTFQDALIVSVIESAKNGNAQNFANIVKLLGEDTQRVELARNDESYIAMDEFFKKMRSEYNENHKKDQMCKM